MSEKITLGSLFIKSRFPVLEVQQCCIHAMYGEHTKANIVCSVKSGEVKEFLTQIEKEKLEVISRKEDGGEEVLFAGTIFCIELEEEGKYATLMLQAVSHTWKMDIERKSRSFQNPQMTYREVVEIVAKEYQGKMNWNISDIQLTHPLIQYQETDFCFIKRILSHLHSGITPEDTRPEINFHTGMRNGINIGNIDMNKYIHAIIPSCNKSGKLGEIGYEISDMDLVRVGDVVRIQNVDYYVMESSSVFLHNVLNCTCRVFPRQCFEKEEIPAENLMGIVLTGTIIEAHQELLRLHLDIDREQPVDEAYDFPWKPITGNLLYAMPETGTKAALYFQESDEGTASAIYNIRENGETCSELSDYNNRYFTTGNEKRMYMKPKEAGLLNMKDQNAEIALKDSSFLQVKSNNRISLMAKGQIELKGKNVSITTPKEATLVRKDILSPTVINLCNAFDAIGKTGNFAAAIPVAEKKRSVPDIGYQREEYSLKGAVSAIFSNIPAVDVENSVIKKIEGSMPIITKIKNDK